VNNEKKVLLIEDNVSVVETLSRALECRGFEVLPAFAGEIGLKRAREKRPDIILLDISLPGIDGYTVCEKLKEDPELSRIPVVMLTGRDRGEDFEKGMDKKADWYIVKPCRIEHLLKVFERLLVQS